MKNIKNLASNKMIDYNKMDNLIQQTYDSRSANGSAVSNNYTLVSMGDKKGKYNLNIRPYHFLNFFSNQVEKKEISNQYSYAFNTRHQKYTMFRIDIDFKTTEYLGNNFNDYWNIEKEIIPFILEINEFLKKHLYDNSKYIDYDGIVKTKPKTLNAVLLTKQPYFSESKKVYKCGFHIQYPYLFLEINAFDYFETNFKPTTLQKGEFDKINNKPWLIYYNCKDIQSDVYKVNCVITKEGKILYDMNKYFEKYKVYDYEEKQIIFDKTKDISYYYPHIFTILPFNRDNYLYDFKIETKIPDIKLNVKKSYTELSSAAEPFEVDDENDENDEIDVPLLVKNCSKLLNLLNDNRFIEYNKWRYTGLMIASIFKGNKDGLELFLEYSQDKAGEAHNEDACIKLYEEFTLKQEGYTGKKLGLGTLKYLAKLDNPEEYNNLNKNMNKEQRIEAIKYGKKAIQNIYTLKSNVKLKTIKKEGNFFFKGEKGVKEFIHVNQENIGDYYKFLEQTDSLLVKSNMRTFKSQNIKGLFDKFHSIAIVSFRRSLDKALTNEFCDYGFKLYSDIEEPKIKSNIYPRVVCQIDSINRLYNNYDLIIFDEINSVLTHLITGSKEKKEIFDALTQRIEHTNKIICLDAFLDNRVVSLFEKYRGCIVLENQYESFKNKNVKIRNITQHPGIKGGKKFYTLLNNIKKDMEEYKKLYIPCNSLTKAKLIESYLTELGYKVKLDSSESNELTPTYEWKNYDAFITTPINVAGVSCCDLFGKTIGVFTDISCTTEFCVQMLFRVRNTESDTIDIYIANDNNKIYSLTPEDIENDIYNIFTAPQQLGLTVNYIDDIIIKNDYYELYVNTKQKENISKMCFTDNIQYLLSTHGISSSIEVIDISSENKDIKKGLELNIKKEEERILNIVNAKDIELDEFIELEPKPNKTPDEKNQVEKYKLRDFYTGDYSITPDFVEKYNDNIMKKHYTNLCLVNSSTVLQEMENIIDIGTTCRIDLSTPESQEKIGLYKRYYALKLLNTIGFNSPFDKSEKKEIDISKTIKFIMDYDKIRVSLFKCKKLEWNEKTPRQSSVMKAVNSILGGVFGISVNKEIEIGRQSLLSSYIIKGFNHWYENKIYFMDKKELEKIYDKYIDFVNDEYDDEENVKPKRLKTN
jgi:hypothetical protein